jgi:outer membrane protein
MQSSKLVWFVLPSLAISAHAQVNNTNKVVRQISLSETLELVLSNNLNLKIERIYPDIARYNLGVAEAGGSTRVGLQRLGSPSAQSLTERDTSYDPTFFATVSKSYVSQPNYLTQDAYNDLKGKADNNALANTTRSTDNYLKEMAAQSEARRDLIRANQDIRTHDGNLMSISDDERMGKITGVEAQLRRTEEQANYEQARANFTQAEEILGNSTARLASAQTQDANNQAMNSRDSLQQSRALDLQNWLNHHSVGDTLPSEGLVDPSTGQLLYRKEIDRTYSFGTGLRGALPVGTIYEIRFDQDLDKSTVFGKEYSSIASITMGQPFLRNFLIDAARANIANAKTESEIVQWGLRYATMNYLTQAQNAYYDLIFAQDNVELQKKAVELAETFVGRTTKMVEANLLAPLDQKQAQAQAASARADLLSAEQQVDIKENALKTLISDDFVKWQNVRLKPSDKLMPFPETYNLTDSWTKALQQRPEYNQARLQLDKQNVMLKFHKNQMLPSLDLIGSFQQNGISTSYGQSVRNIDGGSPSYFVGLIFTMSLENKAPRNNFAIAKAEKERALLLMKQLEQTILIEVDNNIKIAKSDFSRIEATRQAREFAKQAMDSYQSMFEAGKITSFEVLRMQKDYTAAQFAEMSAMVAYNKALAQLYFSEGSSLDRNNVRLQPGK